MEEKIKKLGFGMMRLPRKDGKIDIEQSKKMVDLFMGAGFTYFDTAFVYDGSEEAVRDSLVKRYPRESFKLATKNAAWAKCETREDAIAQLKTSLERTEAGYFDFYLLHSLGGTRTEIFDKFDLWNWALEMKKEGLIRHLGFSFHSTPEQLDGILTKHPEAEFVQLQINYLDWESYSVKSRECYEVARKYGKPVVIMEPVKGGMLANPPKYVEEIFKKAEPNNSAASWAIRFAAGLDGVLTVLSGMSTVEQVEDNISYMSDFTGLTEEEKEVLKEVQKELAKLPLIPCTDCNYCAKVCPKNIGISGSFSAYNVFTQYGDKELALKKESFLVGGSGKLSAIDCIKCGKCEEVCPQHIEIRAELEKVSELFGDIKRAKELLKSGKTFAAVSDNDEITGTDRGVKPLLDLIHKGVSLEKYSVADKVVGKAAAFLYILLKPRKVYAEVISKPAFELLKKHNTDIRYGTIVDLIKNRDNTGFCPMETAVMEAEDAEKALSIIDKITK